MDKTPKQPNYGTISYTYGLGCCETPCLGGIAALPVAMLIGALTNKRMGYLIGIGVLVLGWLFHWLFLEGHITINSDGIKVGSKVRKRFIPWTSITKADRVEGKWGEHTVLWIGDQRIALSTEIQHYGELQMRLWRYLRHYVAECAPPRTRRSKKATRDQEEETS